MTLRLDMARVAIGSSLLTQDMPCWIWLARRDYGISIGDTHRSVPTPVVVWVRWGRTKCVNAVVAISMALSRALSGGSCQM